MPGGRPPKIGTIVLTRQADDGTTTHITAGQRVVEAIRIGNYIETAAAMAGVDKTTIYEWLKVGAAATDALTRQGKHLRDLSQHQRACMAFSHAVAEAEALAEVEDVAALASLGAGGRQIVTTTVKRDADGKVLEHRTKTETAPPRADVLMWRLERRHPDRWGRRRLELSGPDGEAIPVEVRVRALVAAAEQFHGEAIETTGSEGAEVADRDDEAGRG